MAGRVLLSTGIPELDRLLPGHGVRPNCMVEWLGEQGAGTWVLGLLGALRACSEEQWIVIVDPAGEFYPPAARQWGLNLSRLLLVRPANLAGAVWAIDESLRHSSVGAVIGCIDRLTARDSRRLQLAAETGGRLCVLLRPCSARWESSWAEIRWYVKAHPSSQVSPRRVHVELLRCRGGSQGGEVELELDHEAGTVRLATCVAAPAADARSAGADLQAAGAL